MRKTIYLEDLEKLERIEDKQDVELLTKAMATAKEFITVKDMGKIPDFKDDEELAESWDTHDFTGYAGDTEECDDTPGTENETDLVVSSPHLMESLSRAREEKGLLDHEDVFDKPDPDGTMQLSEKTFTEWASDEDGDHDKR